MNFHVTERISKSITCNFCCLWKNASEMPSRIVGFNEDEIASVALVAGWSTVIIGDENVRAGDVLNICAICKDRASQDLGRKFHTSKLDMDSAKLKLGMLTHPDEEVRKTFAPDASDGILHSSVGEKGPW